MIIAWCVMSAKGEFADYSFFRFLFYGLLNPVVMAIIGAIAAAIIVVIYRTVIVAIEQIVDGLVWGIAILCCIGSVAFMIFKWHSMSVQGEIANYPFLGFLLFSILNPLIVIIIGVFVLGIIFILLPETVKKNISKIDVNRLEEERKAETRKRDLDRYNAELQEYKRNVDKEQKRLDKTVQINRLLENELSALRGQYDHARWILHELYSLNILYPKYRNFIMVSSMYEYFCARRCTSLEGHEGAYNILETEIRLDRIINKLDDVIRHLEDVQDNQHMLYSTIQDGNRTISNLLRSTSNLENSIGKLEAQGSELNSRIADLQSTSALNLYFNELNSIELAYRRQWGI